MISSTYVFAGDIIYPPLSLQSIYKVNENTNHTNLLDDSSVSYVNDNAVSSIEEQDEISVHINKVEVTESLIFSEEEITGFKALLEGKDVTAEDINNFIDLINSKYIEKEVITARAFIKDGKLENGVLKIELMEAKVGNVAVEGNRFNRKGFLKSRISEKPGDLLDLIILERDLKQFNRNAKSVSLSAKLEPGEEYGTTNIILNAKENFPFHLSLSSDNFGRESTGLYRGGLMVSTDSLLGFQDRLSVAVNLSRSSANPYIDYNIPINRKGTRVGVSYMYGKNKVISGQYEDFDLNADTHTAKGYFTHPFINSEKGSLSLSTSANFKYSEAAIEGYVYSNYIDYNISVGLDGQKNFKRSILYGSVYSTNGLIQDRIRDTDSYFTKVTADSYYIQYLPLGIIATLKAGGQFSPQNISYVEQYQIGGISSVRGYSESLLIAPSGYFASAEILLPIFFLPEEINVPSKNDVKKFRLRDSIKLAAFFDHGITFPYGESFDETNLLMSAGGGVRVGISKYLTARVYVGVPFMNKDLYQQENVRVHFDIIASPF